MAQFEREKFKALVHYISSRCEDDPSRLGAVKLNKILWYAEIGKFVRTGTALTGARYIKRQFGPVPADIQEIVAELEQERKLAVKDVPYHKYDKREYISLREPDVDVFFSASDIVDINRVIDMVCDTHSATTISEQSHNEPWQLAEIGEELPFYTALAIPGEITEEDLKWADKKIATLKA
jgi:hypothetical protein